MKCSKRGQRKERIHAEKVKVVVGGGIEDSPLEEGVAEEKITTISATGEEKPVAERRGETRF